MSLLNGISGLGSGLMAFAGSAAKDAEAQQQAATPAPTPAPEATPAAAPEAPPANPLAGPRMPTGPNPYSGDPHAQALWQAELAIKGPESGGKADAQNPVSSAGGLFQVVDKTWDAALNKMGIPLAVSEAERNAQKYRPDLNTAVMRQINTDAAGALDAAGLPVTVQTLQAAHRLGPAGAAAAIKAAMADPSAPLIGNGLPITSVRGNQDISHLSVGQFLLSPYPKAGGS